MQCDRCGAMVAPGTRRCPNCNAWLNNDQAYDNDAGGRDQRTSRDDPRRRAARGRQEPARRDDPADDYGDAPNSTRRRDDPARGGSRRSSRGSNTSNADADNDSAYNEVVDDAGRARDGRARFSGPRPSSRPNPLDDPRAPGFFKEPAPRRNEQADPGYRGVSGRGRDEQGERGGNPRENALDERGLPYNNRDNRNQGRSGRPLAPLEPPSPPTSGRYGERFGGDDGDSMEMSAEYSAEMKAGYSAEYSAEYPDPRGYSQRGDYNAYDDYGANQRNAGNAGNGGWQNQNARDYDVRGGRQGGAYPAYPPYQEPNRGNAWGNPADGRNGGWDTESAEWDSLSGASEIYPPFQPEKRGRGGVSRGASRRASNRRGPILISIVVLVVAVVAIVAGIAVGPSLFARIKNGATASDNAPPFVTYTPGPTPTPPANYKEFDNTHAFYTLDYPQSWSSSSSSTPIDGQYDYLDQFTRATPQASFIVEQAGAFAGLARSDIIKAEVQGGESNGRTFAQISSPVTTMEIGGEQWLRSDYMVTQQDGSKLHMIIIACHHRQLGYAIVLVSLPDNYAQDSQTVFEPILNTFHFTH